jgi:hypothetical protein
MNGNGNKDIDVFPIGVVEHSGKAYWTWKIGWMVTALLGVLSLGSAILFLAPSVSRLTSRNEQLRSELSESQEKDRVAIDVSSCRNKYDLKITEALINNTIAQNNFVISLSGADHTLTIADQTTYLNQTSDDLTFALVNRKAYDLAGSPIPCPFPGTPVPD